MSEENMEIKFKIERENPINAKDFLNSILAFDELLKEFCDKSVGAQTELKLVEVEKGSDIFKFIISLGKNVLPLTKELVEGVNSVFNFINNFKTLSQKSVDDIRNDESLTEKNIKNTELLVNLTNDDVSVSVSVTSGNTHNNYILINNDNKDSFKEGLSAARRIKDFNSVEQSSYNAVLIKIYAIKDSEKLVRDSCICDEIEPNRVIAVELPLDIKETIKKAPFANYYLVNLSVNRIEGKIKLYRVSELLKIIPKEIEE